MYRFAVYSSMLPFPLCFVVHTWVELTSPVFGTKRYDVHGIVNKATKGYVFTNAPKPGMGMPILYIPNKYVSSARYTPKCIFSIEGASAQQVIETVEQNIAHYPYTTSYHLLPGPNSNTFTQWILNLSPLTKNFRLRWNAFGKNFVK